MGVFGKKISFWTLLQEKRIVIPIIQRDYAQGRIGMEYLRERFLNKLFNSIIKTNSQPIVLDFVYGSTYSNDIFYPLDGQQRLTTLWLLHWYISLASMKLYRDKESLLHFSYQTRSSSRLFCEQLCNIDESYRLTDNDYITDYIRNQNWYYSLYDQDPTIQSMMRMLGGTAIDNNNDGKIIIDGIEKCLRNVIRDGVKIADIYDNLFSGDSKIMFFLLNMDDENMPLSDDLYIKMNARGKLLTDFESFKVDILGYKSNNNESLFTKEGEMSFSHKMDTEWIDMFWCNRSEDNRIDEIMLEFFNRFFLDWYVSNASIGKNPEQVSSDIVYKNLTATDQRYQNISFYEPALSIDSIERLTCCLNNIYIIFRELKYDMNKIDKLFQPYWEEDEAANPDRKEATFHFIPTYINGGSLPKITQQQRVVFHAVVMFFTKVEGHDINGLKEWMRFIWNMVENSYIDKTQAISAIRFFEHDLKELHSKIQFSCSGITMYLSGIDTLRLPKNIFGRRQLLEEIAKAKKIYANDTFDKIWANKIHLAESELFFKGAIAFLLNDENGEPVGWEHFDKKLSTAKKIFDKYGVRKDCLVSVLSRFYSLCSNFDKQLWWSKKVFNGKADTWKNSILTMVDEQYKYVYANNVHHLLLDDDYSQPCNDKKIQTLANHAFVDYILKKNENYRDMYIRWPHCALYFCGNRIGVLLDYEQRDIKILEMLKDKRFCLRDPDVKIADTGKFWGFDIDLVYLGQGQQPVNLRWYRERDEYDMYLMNKNWDWCFRDTFIEEEKGDRKKYRCFNIESSMNIDEIIGLIEKEMK